MEDLKNHRTVKIGGWALVQVWALAQDNTVFYQMFVVNQRRPSCMGYISLSTVGWWARFWKQSVECKLYFGS